MFRNNNTEQHYFATDPFLSSQCSTPIKSADGALERTGPYLVSCRQSGPGFVCTPVVVLSFSHLHIVAEADEDFSFPQLVDCGPLVQLHREDQTNRDA